mmetsp:Transcript_14757/g.39211  ORF Transcript_14757/g.39211 Transcript_14757/m.39211 type:complete len:169 (+) Transcript_14757:84-590(+)|eukprot:CAMPEP_0177188130 /NCGR_PEP_ID=MMETSP0367-20130122/19564_1 /TAXON_ID=447022 ORGANISM="Scrippsiella hangoei-like, Strain SHHI-4" /NCGR_SAMPLE_ID=MMETSP0367 /ASSEMBLY_ACC=CAM_ASM_000362 /LENGTH=168 /DNA_ID=CAMNT_0018635567 /DNA_START=83 /DNA_END=589 /DNA_ORIENTATION=+
MRRHWAAAAVAVATLLAFVAADAVAGVPGPTWQPHPTAAVPVDDTGFWSLPPAGRALMFLGVMFVLYSGSWRILLFLLAMQLSAHLNAGWNGPPPMPTQAPPQQQQLQQHAAQPVQMPTQPLQMPSDTQQLQQQLQQQAAQQQLQQQQQQQAAEAVSLMKVMRTTELR